MLPGGTVRLGLRAAALVTAVCISMLGPGAALASGPSTGGAPATGTPAPGHPGFAVGEIVVRFTDDSRFISRPGQRRVPRTLVTVIRYPAAGDPSRVDVIGAPPARRAGPFPLVIFAHGFDITPAPYARLLRAWTRAGYVVAAPIFPVTNANAPGGPDESDLVNQPTDVSFVITQLLAASTAAHGILTGLIDADQIAVSGQSDGGSTALAVADNAHYADRRVRAAMILSGAEIPGVGGYAFPPPAPPLLAVQGSDDIFNAPESTYEFFRRAPRPKFLLTLPGAPHLGPYTYEQPQLGIVEQVTIAFLDRYLKADPGARARMWKAGDVPSVATLSRGAPRRS